MPKYLNTASYPIYFGDAVFPPQTPVETLDVIDNLAFVVGVIGQPYNITTGVNDTLLIRFNNEDTWTTVTLTAGASQTAQDVADDINAAYDSTVAYSEGGHVKLIAPRIYDDFSAVWIGTTGGTANSTVGLFGSDFSPKNLVARQVFINCAQIEPYNITSSNNTFIFKFNDEDWITATLTTGAARTAEEIAADLNDAYFAATGKEIKIAQAVELISGSGEVRVQLLAPVVNNYQSKIYIKETGNTALTVLGFGFNDSIPLIINQYPQLFQLETLPLYNPIISSTEITFSGAGWSVFYTNFAVTVTKYYFTAATANFDIYIEDVSNLPPIYIPAGSSFTLEHKVNRINKLLINSSGAGKLTIQELIE